MSRDSESRVDCASQFIKFVDYIITTENYHNVWTDKSLVLHVLMHVRAQYNRIDVN